MGARTVVTGADDNRALSGAVPHRGRRARTGLAPLGRGQGPACCGHARPPVALPQVRAYDRDPPSRSCACTRPAPVVVDGGADALAGLAAFGALQAGSIAGGRPFRRPVPPRPQAGSSSLRTPAPPGSGARPRRDRRRQSPPRSSSRGWCRTGATLAAGDRSRGRGRAGSVRRHGRADGRRARGRRVDPRAVHPLPQFPEHRPFAALDGDRATYWASDRALSPTGIGSRSLHGRDVAGVDLEPYSDHLCKVLSVEVAGRRFDVHDGVNRLSLGLHGVSSLRVRIAAVRCAAGMRKRAGGIRELAIPGVHATEALRPPVAAERALAGRDVSATGLTYLFQRTTGDDPFRRDPWHGPATAGLVRDRSDGRPAWSGCLAARGARVDGRRLGSAAPAPDSALDRPAA